MIPFFFVYALRNWSASIPVKYAEVLEVNDDRAVIRFGNTNFAGEFVKANKGKAFLLEDRIK